jgi:glycosyltransferase involved in cell wall biosynthesis
VPRFSIVVTTCDRPSLLPAAVRSALEMRFDDFELIVSDNFSKVPAAEILADCRDERVRIIRTDRRLPVSDHWEFAWERVQGEFAMYIGDDNALHPDILALSDRAIREHDLEVISWRVSSYFHPDWNITYGSLPSFGNVVGVDAGTTGKLYRAREDEVLQQFARQLRLSGCFPCMVNFVFPKARADYVRRKAGRFFWAPNPDIAATYFILGTIDAGRYGFFDGFGALGGRSVDSNLATLLSRGKKSRRAYEYFEDFRDQDCLPHHDIKFVAISNALAATISQARTLLPEHFAPYQFDRKVLALRTVDDMYVDRTVPWVDDPRFLDGVERFLQSLPADAAGEARAYRAECMARLEEAERRGETADAPRPWRSAAVSLLGLLRRARPDAGSFEWQLFRDTGRNPLRRHWQAGSTTYVDMDLYGGRDIADAARNLPRILSWFDKRDAAFLAQHRAYGMLGDELALASGLDAASRSEAYAAAAAQ